jgi:hypothetical protein
MPRFAHVFWPLFALLQIACIAACSTGGDDGVSSDAEEVEAPARWNVNDVSFLFPFPKRGEGNQLLAMQTPSAGGVKTLLPETVFKLLGDQAAGVPFLVEAPGRDQLYPQLRVTAVRVDPCFDAHDPRTETRCVRQVRLVVQPMRATSANEADSDYELFDASVHLFYPLDDAAFVRLARGLRDLKRENTGNPSLGVHPVMMRQGLAGPFAARLKELVLEACDAESLSRMTFMATGRGGNNWFWGILDRGPDGSFTAQQIATRPPGTKEDSFVQNSRSGPHDGTSLHSPLFPDSLLKSGNIAGLSDTEFTSAIDKLQRIANPKELATSEVSCATCHVAANTLGDAVDRRGLSSTPATPSAFVAPTGQNVSVVDTTHFAGNNMHAFSWLEHAAVVTPRVANESARIADFIATEDFTRSLPAPLQAEWRRP